MLAMQDRGANARDDGIKGAESGPRSAYIFERVKSLDSKTRVTT